MIPGKGRGMITKREFNKNEFVCEYAGELIDSAEGKRRENNLDRGSYIYYFQHKGKNWW